jgi:hypothetical protein
MFQVAILTSCHGLRGKVHIATGTPADEYGPSASPIRYCRVTVCVDCSITPAVLRDPRAAPYHRSAEATAQAGRVFRHAPMRDEIHQAGRYFRVAWSRHEIRGVGIFVYTGVAGWCVTVGTFRYISLYISFWSYHVGGSIHRNDEQENKNVEHLPKMCFIDNGASSEK